MLDFGEVTILLFVLAGAVLLILIARWSLKKLLFRFAWVTEDAFARCSQWYVDILSHRIVRQKIKSIINLRGSNPEHWWWRHEVRFAENNGIERWEATMSSRRLPNKNMMNKLVDALTTAQQPFLLKCAGGQDRTSFSAVLFILQRDSWDAYPAALAEFRRWPFGRMKKTQRWLPLFFEYAHKEANGTPILEWARNAYDPYAFRDWLAVKGHGDEHEGIHPEEPHHVGA